MMLGSRNPGRMGDVGIDLMPNGPVLGLRAYTERTHPEDFSAKVCAAGGR